MSSGVTRHQGVSYVVAKNSESLDPYSVIGIIVGLLTALGTWIYAIISWGFLLGLGFGWIPAIVAGYVAGFLWPLLLIGLAIFGWLMLR